MSTWHWRGVAPGAHAVLLVDQAGWHLSAELTVPDNIVDHGPACHLVYPEERRREEGND